MFFKRAFISLFLIFSTLFLFISFIRISNGRTGFLGLNDLFNYFESVDMNKPLNRFTNDIRVLSKSWQALQNDTSGMPVASGGAFTEIYQDLPASQNNIYGSTTFKVLNYIAQVITLPFRLIGDFILMICDYISIFIGFISWSISFEGYTIT